VPSTLIEVRRTYTPDQQVALINAVHAALVAAFKIPRDDRYIRLTRACLPYARSQVMIAKMVTAAR
jgi:hypothetical protein